MFFVTLLTLQERRQKLLLAKRKKENFWALKNVNIVIMFIYLDESYNLKDRSKKQFISINGFMTPDVSRIRKKWLRARKPYIKRKRIHANERHFEPLRKQVINIVKNNEIFLLSAFQDIQSIPFHHDKQYFTKNKLNFEKVYTDICKKLLLSLKLNEYKKIILVIDNRKHKAGPIGKNKFRQEIEYVLKNTYPGLNINKPRLAASTSDILLELCDFISNTFYRSYINNNEELLTNLKIKIIQLKNPLTN